MFIATGARSISCHLRDKHQITVNLLPVECSNWLSLIPSPPRPVQHNISRVIQDVDDTLMNCWYCTQCGTGPSSTKNKVISKHLKKGTCQEDMIVKKEWSMKLGTSIFTSISCFTIHHSLYSLPPSIPDMLSDQQPSQASSKRNYLHLVDSRIDLLQKYTKFDMTPDEATTSNEELLVNLSGMGYSPSDELIYTSLFKILMIHSPRHFTSRALRLEASHACHLLHVVKGDKVREFQIETFNNHVLDVVHVIHDSYFKLFGAFRALIENFAESDVLNIVYHSIPYRTFYP